MASSLTFPKSANDIRLGDYVMHNQKPSKIVSLNKSKTGKHGGCKITYTCSGIFDDKRADGMIMSYDRIDCPVSKKIQYYVMDIEDPESADDEKVFVSLMNEDDGSTRADVKITDMEMARKVSKAFDDGKDVYVTVVEAMEENRVISFKVNWREIEAFIKSCKSECLLD